MHETKASGKKRSLRVDIEKSNEATASSKKDVRSLRSRPVDSNTTNSEDIQSKRQKKTTFVEHGEKGLEIKENESLKKSNDNGDQQKLMKRKWKKRNQKLKQLEMTTDTIWDTYDQTYFQNITQTQLAHLEFYREQAALIVTSNRKYLPTALPKHVEQWQIIENDIKDAYNSCHLQENALQIPLRGRYYKEIWEEEQFIVQYNQMLKKNKNMELSSGDTFEVEINNENLVHGYSDDLFNNYIDYLETLHESDFDTERDFKVLFPKVPLYEIHPAACGSNCSNTCSLSFVFSTTKAINYSTLHPASAIRITTTGGNSSNSKKKNSKNRQLIYTLSDDIMNRRGSTIPDIWMDELSTYLEQCIRQYANQNVVNWQRIQRLYESVLTDHESYAILHREKLLMNKLEAYYYVVQEHNISQEVQEGEDSDTDENSPTLSFMASFDDIICYKIANLSKSLAASFTFSCKFSKTLEIGDKVDYLNNIGNWVAGVIINKHATNYVCIGLINGIENHLLNEWVAIHDGRIMPPHSCVPQKYEGKNSTPTLSPTANGTKLILKSPNYTEVPTLKSKMYWIGTHLERIFQNEAIHS